MDLQTLEKRVKCLLNLTIEPRSALSEASIKDMRSLTWAERMFFTGLYQPSARGPRKMTFPGNLPSIAVIRTKPNRFIVRWHIAQKATYSVGVSISNPIRDSQKQTRNLTSRFNGINTQITSPRSYD